MGAKITPVQVAGNIQHLVVPASNTQTLTLTATFGANLSAGNSLIAWVFLNQSGAGVDNLLISFADGLGNAYSPSSSGPPGGSNNGAGYWFYCVGNIHGGTNTVTFKVSCIAGTFGVPGTYECTLLVAEYSSLPSPIVQSISMFGIYGSAGNFPVTLNLTDSHAASLSVTVQSPGATGSNGIGTVNTGFGIVDIFSGGVNYIIAAALAGLNTVLVPTSAYQTFAQEVLVSDATNTSYGYLWDYGTPGPSVIAQPQVCVLT